MTSEALWQPSADTIANARMTDFLQQVNTEKNVALANYHDLYQWSVDNDESFWSMVWDYFDVIGEKGSTVVTDKEKMPGAKWFPEAKLNFAENLLRHKDDHIALIFRGENGVRQQLTYAELNHEVAAFAAGLRQRGVEAGDRVAAMMPNCIETIIGMLATTSIGAIWSSCSPDFGVQGVLDRFGQIEPKVLITVDGYFYNGKNLNIKSKTADIIKEIKSIEATVVVNFSQQKDRLKGENVFAWNDFGDAEQTQIDFVPRNFNDPLYIMFSSGTTGVPKCIVHGTGGTLLQHVKEHGLHTDLDRDDNLFYFTTCGWMMWNWLVSGLAVGATLTLFDGSPFAPEPEFLWDVADEEGITVFGTSAKYLAALEKADVKPRESHNLEKLRSILTTGSVLPPESFDYVYRDIKKDLCLSSISGGTDIVSCFALGCPILPVYRGELQCRGLGLAVNVYDDNGKPVRGEKANLSAKTHSLACQ